MLSNNISGTAFLFNIFVPVVLLLLPVPAVVLVTSSCFRFLLTAVAPFQYLQRVMLSRHIASVITSADLTKTVTDVKSASDCIHVSY
jgi:hypothetical protein